MTTSDLLTVEAWRYFRIFNGRLYSAFSPAGDHIHQKRTVATCSHRETSAPGQCSISNCSCGLYAATRPEGVHYFGRRIGLALLQEAENLRRMEELGLLESSTMLRALRRGAIGLGKVRLEAPLPSDQDAPLTGSVRGSKMEIIGPVFVVPHEVPGVLLPPPITDYEELSLFYEVEVKVFSTLSAATEAVEKLIKIQDHNDDTEKEA